MRHQECKRKQEYFFRIIFIENTIKRRIVKERKSGERVGVFRKYEYSNRFRKRDY